MRQFLIQNQLSYFSFIMFLAVLPWSIAAMQIFAVLSVIFFIIEQAYQKKSPIQYQPFFIVLGIYFLWQLITSYLSPKPIISMQAALHNDWFILLVPFIASFRFTDEQKNTVWKTVIISAAIVGIYAIFQFSTGGAFFRSGKLAVMGDYFRASGGYNFYLTFAGNQLFALAIAFSFFLKQQKWDLSKFILTICSLLIFISILSTFARSVWIASVFIFLTGTWFLDRRLFLLTIFGLIATGILVSFVNPDIYLRIISIFDPSQNEARINIWKTAFAMFKDYPITGVGHSVFNDLFSQYQVPGHYDAAGHAHNDMLNVAVNSGIIGLISWLLVWIFWFSSSIKTLFDKRLKRIDAQILYGNVLGIGGILIAGMFQCYYSDLENNIFWWFVAATGLMVNREYREKAASE